MIDESLLHRCQAENTTVTVALRVALNGEDRFAGKKMCIIDACAAFGLGAIGLDLDNCTGMADALTAAKMRARQVEIFVQKVDHRHPERNVNGSDCDTINRQCQRSLFHILSRNLLLISRSNRPPQYNFYRNLTRS